VEAEHYGLVDDTETRSAELTAPDRQAIEEEARSISMGESLRVVLRVIDIWKALGSGTTSGAPARRGLHLLMRSEVGDDSPERRRQLRVGCRRPFGAGSGVGFGSWEWRPRLYASAPLGRGNRASLEAAN
jgi:hypothetical protein